MARLDLNKIVQKAMGAIDKSVAGVVETVTLRRDTGPIVRSTQDGTISRSQSDISTRAVITGYSLQEIQTSIASGGEAIQPEDAKCLIAAQDLGLSIEPAPADTVIRTGAAVWSVVTVKSIPSRSLWILQLRRPG